MAQKHGYIHIRVGYIGILPMYPTRIWMYPQKWPKNTDTSIFGLGTLVFYQCTQPEYGCIRKNGPKTRIHPYSGWVHWYFTNVPNPNMDVSAKMAQKHGSIHIRDGYIGILPMYPTRI